MTTRKIVIAIVGVLLTLGLLVVVFAGGIVAFAFYQIGNSQAADNAKDFLKNNERLKQDIGQFNDFGTFITGNVSGHNDTGEATLNLKVIGERKTVNASVGLIFRGGRIWRVVSASYIGDSGQTVNLLDPYDSKMLVPPGWIDSDMYG